MRLHGGPAPVRRYLPHLIDLVLKGVIDPGKVFDLTLPLDQVAEGYRAMDERRAIKTQATRAVPSPRSCRRLLSRSETALCKSPEKAFLLLVLHHVRRRHRRCARRPTARRY